MATLKELNTSRRIPPPYAHDHALYLDDTTEDSQNVLCHGYGSFPNRNQLNAREVSDSEAIRAKMQHAAVESDTFLHPFADIDAPHDVREEFAQKPLAVFLAIDILFRA